MVASILCAKHYATVAILETRTMHNSTDETIITNTILVVNCGFIHNRNEHTIVRCPMCACVRACVRASVCVRACVHAWFACAHVCERIRACVRAYTTCVLYYVRACVRACMCVCVCARAYTLACVHVRLRMCVRAYIRACVRHWLPISSAY